MKLFLKNNKGIALLIISLLVLALFKLSPALAQHVYRNFIFQIFRVVWDYSIALLPFPLIYLLIILTPFFLFFYIKSYEKKYNILWRLPLNLLGWVVSIFLWMWGYNYCTPTLTNQLAINNISTQELYEFGVSQGEIVNKISDELARANNEMNTPSVEALRICVEDYLNTKHWKTFGNVRCQVLHDAGAMRRLGISGVYIPYTGQGQTTATHHALYLPFVVAHELSHGYGITSEAEADFVAYKALTNSTASNNVLLKYIAELELLRSIRSQLYAAHDSLRMRIDSTLHQGVMADIKSLRENALLYPEYFRGLQTTMNDAYLKSMGIQDGVLNYDKFVNLVWQERKR
jgi:Protein of unknown function (DUF3810)